MDRFSKYLIVIAVTVLVTLGAVKLYGGGMLQGNFSNTVQSSGITFEVSEESLSEDEMLTGPDNSVLLARFKIKSDENVTIQNLQLDLVNNEFIADNVAALYIKFPSDKYQPTLLEAYSKIKWNKNSPRFGELNFEIPANSDDVRFEVYAILKDTLDSMESLQVELVNFGYLSEDSSVIKVSDVNFTSQNELEISQ